MSTSTADPPHNLALAVSLLAAWQHRETLGDAVFASVVQACLDDAGTPENLVVGLASLAVGLLKGIERCADQILSSPAIVARAGTAIIGGTPLTSRDVGLDQGTMLERIGGFATSIPRRQT